jgi:hypothetical protein
MQRKIQEMRDSYGFIVRTARIYIRLKAFGYL